MRLGIGGFELDRPAVAVRGLIQVAERLIDQPEISLDDRGGRVECGGLADVFQGRLVLAHLMSDQTEQVQCIDLGRIGLENLPINLLGLLQIAGLVRFDGECQRFGNGVHEMLGIKSCSGQIDRA